MCDTYGCEAAEEKRNSVGSSYVEIICREVFPGDLFCAKIV